MNTSIIFEITSCPKNIAHDIMEYASSHSINFADITSVHRSYIDIPFVTADEWIIAKRVYTVTLGIRNV